MDCDEGSESSSNEMEVTQLKALASSSSKKLQKKKKSVSNSASTDESRTPKKRRTKKDDPFVISSITKNDLLNSVMCTMMMRFDDDKKQNVEFYGAESINVNGESFNLMKQLNSDQLRDVTKNLGIPNAGGLSKQLCIERIAQEQEYRKASMDSGVVPADKYILQRNTQVLAINVVLSSDYQKRFVQVNDGKKRSDHETGNMFKHFWQAAAASYNDYDDVEDTAADTKYNLVNPNDSKKAGAPDTFPDYLEMMITDPPIDLRDRKTVVPLSPELFERKIKLLFKVRRQISVYMDASGENGNLFSKYVDNAIKAVKKEDSAVGKLHRVSVYYFCIRCADIGDEIDAAFQPFLDETLKGSTHDMGPAAAKKQNKSMASVLATMSTAAKESSNQMMKLMADSSNDMKAFLEMTREGMAQDKCDAERAATELEKTNKETALTNKELIRTSDEANSQNKMMIAIEIAKALGDTKKLEALMKKME